MAETIDGGCYQTADGRYVTAEGKPATKTQIAEHQMIQEQRAAELDAIEQENTMRIARNDPAARAFAALSDRLAPAQPAAPSKPAKPASKPATPPDPGNDPGNQTGDLA